VSPLVPALVLALAAGGPAPADPQPSPPAPFTESIDVRVVNVEAVVTDRKVERVRGLTAADFRLLVDGKEVPVDYFSEIADGAALPAAPALRQEGEPQPAPAPLPARSGRNLLIFIDESFVIAAQRDQVLQGLERDLARLGPEDRVALVAFDGMKLTQVCDWTGGRAAQAAAFATARRRPARGSLVLAERRRLLNDMELVRQAFDSDTEGRGALELPSTGPAAEMATREAQNGAALGPGDPKHYSWLVRAANAAAAAVRGFPPPPPGRKLLLLLSGNWPVPGLVAPLAQEANRVGYTIYPVDVPGTDLMRLVGDADRDRPTAAGETFTGFWENSSHRTLELLAEATGGRAALNSARLDALARAVDDTGSYYWLGFTPAWRADDRRHSIRLEVRRPGLSVRSRLGFSDLSPRTEEALHIESLLLFGESREGSPDLIVSLGAVRRTGAQTVDVPVTLELPAEALTPSPSAAGWLAEATLSVGALDRLGTRSDLPTVPVRLTLPAPPAPGGRVRWHATIKLRRIEQRLVFSLRDALSGTVLWQELDFQP
jgi:VWFA-related protein